MTPSVRSSTSHARHRSLPLPNLNSGVNMPSKRPTGSGRTPETVARRRYYFHSAPCVRDVADIGHYGTGDLEIVINSAEDFEDAKPLFVKSYEAR